MRHHATASGYDRLADYLDGTLISPISDWHFYQRAIARAGRFLIRRAGSCWYHRDAFMTELEATRKWMRRGGQVFHYLYGENSYRYLGNLKALGIRNRIVCTYHTPLDKFNQLITNKKPLARLDAVIVVSSVQQQIFTDIISPDKVHFIPHGIDTDFFRPAENRGRNDICKCLCVGSHLRDFDVLASAMGLLKHKTLELTVISSTDQRDKFKGFDNVILLSNVRDDQLLSIYQSSDIFIMPVTDCTANNALLEAMACGLPVVATDLPGIRDYVRESFAVLTAKGDARALADGIELLAGDDNKRGSMASASREHALNFAWEKVADQVKRLYVRLDI